MAASASGIRAGLAYIELTVKSDLTKRLSAAMKQLRAFGEGMRDFGLQMTAMGLAIVGPMIAAAKSFADAGDKLATLQAKTGLSLEALNGLAEAARLAGVPVDTLTDGVRAMQRAIGGGGKEAAEMFARLGTSAGELQALSTSDALGLLADRMAQVTDLNERAAIAQKLFGKSGAEFLPIIANGAQGLNDAAAAARAAGSGMSGPALEASKALTKEFNALGGAMLSLRNAVGTAVAPALTVLINGLSHTIQLASQWLSKNPALVQSYLNMGVAITGVGLAVTALGTAIYAAMSPTIAITALVAGMGFTMLALNDVLGITQTGFGNLFNSIRIGGTGLGTWLGKLAVRILQDWNNMTHLMGMGWDAFVNMATDLGSVLFEGLIWVPKKLLEGFRFLVDTAGTLLNGLASAWNFVFGEAVGKIEMEFGSAGVLDDPIEWLDNKQSEISNARLKRGAQYDNDKRRAAMEAEAIDRRLMEMSADLDFKDPNDGSSGVGFDKQKFKDALAEIGGNVGGLIKSLLGAMPGLGGSGSQSGAAFGVDTGGISNSVERHFDVAGTFNASAAGQLGFGSSIQERTAKATERTAKAAEETRDLVRVGVRFA